MAYHLKNNLVSPELARKAWELVLGSHRITLLTHEKPDADGISACAAFAAVLERQGKKVEAIYPSRDEAFIKRQPSTVLIKQHQQTPDLIVMFDTANYERLYFPDAFKNIPSINIDHHISSTINATVNLVTDKVSSTCELLYFLLLEWAPAQLDKYVAECLLFGILYDSQTFKTLNTQSSTLHVGADLLDRGANLHQLQAELRLQKDPATVRLWGQLLSNLQVTPSGVAAWCSVSTQQLKQAGLEHHTVGDFSNILASLCDTDVTIFFYELSDGKTKVSLRSKKTDVNNVAGQLGGGGHKNAAGITMTIPFDDAIKKVTELL